MDECNELLIDSRNFVVMGYVMGEGHDMSEVFCFEVRGPICV